MTISYYFRDARVKMCCLESVMTVVTRGTMNNTGFQKKKKSCNFSFNILSLQSLSVVMYMLQTDCTIERLDCTILLSMLGIKTFSQFVFFFL